MDIIISPAEIKKHRVSKYSFKPIVLKGEKATLDQTAQPTL